MLYLIGLIAFARLITQSQCAQTFYNVGTDLNWQSGNSLILNQGSYADVLRSFKLEKGKLLQFPQAFQFFGQQFQYLIVNSFGTLTFSNVNLADTRGNLMPVEIPISTDSGVDTQQRIPFNNNNVVEEDLEVINRDVLGTDPATEEDVYFIYLGQEATASELADLIRELQELNVTAGFRVTITRIYPELNTLTVRGVSKEALDFIKLNSIVSAVIRNFRTLRTQFIEEASPQDYLNATDRLLFKQTSYTDNRFKTEQVSASWGQDRIDQPFLPLNGQYNIPPATNAGQNVDVYMFDTGLDTVHPEFTTGPFNSVRTVRNVFSSYGPLISDNDVDGHGTHTAGTVGGATVGIAPAANIYGVKVLDNNGVGTLQDILDGFQFVIQQRQVDPNRKIVVSMSLGYGCSRDCPDAGGSIYADLLADQYKIAVVVSAGNEGRPASMNSPSSSRSSITVGAISIDDSVTNFSNRRLFVDVYGPGRFITSACSAAASCTGLYATYSGTSMSCPHASGVVALWLSQTNEVAADPLQLRKVIECTGSRGVITGLGKNDKNVILQVPDSSTSLRAAVCAEVDSGCGGCPRNAECYYGQCICGDYWDGAQCTVMNPYISSLYASNVFVYGGSIDVSVDSSPPYNTLAFHWALYAYESQSATAYAGPITTKDGRRAYVVVFHRAPRQQASVGTICLVTVEVVLYLDDFSIDVVLVSSDGTACTQDSKSAVVTGFKGARFSEDVPSTVQSALLSVTNKKPPLSAKWTLVPTGVSTSSQPTFSPSFRPTNSGTISPTQKPTVKPTVKSTIKPTIKPSARPTLQPTFGPTVLRSQDPLCSTPFVTFLLSSALERMDRTGESQVDYGTVAGYQVVVRSNTRSLFATKDSQTIVCQEASVFSPTNSPAMISSPSPAPINQPLCSQPFVKLLLSEGLAKIDREGIAFVDYGLVNQYAVVVDAGSRCLTASKGTEIIVCC